MKAKKTNKVIIVIIAIAQLTVILITFVVYNYVLYIPSFLCDYIEYNGEKYYALTTYAFVDIVDFGGIDNTARVPIVLYNSAGKRIGFFRKHYAYKRSNDKDVEFLHFESGDYTKNPELW